MSPKLRKHNAEFLVPEAGESEEKFVAGLHRRFPHKQKSVLVKVLTRNGKFALCVEPYKVPEGEVAVVPVQGRLAFRSNVQTKDASRILMERAGIAIPSQRLQYIGCGFTTNHTDGTPDGKLLHIVGGLFGEKPTQLPPTEYAKKLSWVPVSVVPSYAEQILSPQKRWLLEQAVLAAHDTRPNRSLFRADVLFEAYCS